MPKRLEKTNILSMTQSSEAYRAHGKILLTAEYLVLHGARALAIPLVGKFQELKVTPHQNDEIIWQAYDENKDLYFEAILSHELEIRKSTDLAMAKTLATLLKVINDQNPQSPLSGKIYQTQMNFNRHYGLGSSSSLISLLAQYAQVNPFKMLEATFGGSGYDLACAVSKRPLLFSRPENVEFVHFDPCFQEHLYFVYLNKKQSSKKEVINFLSKSMKYEREIEQINQLTVDFLEASSIDEFNTAINKHEEIIAQVLQRKTIKEELFADFFGSIKSLGAWGGDIILVSSPKDPSDYFKSKGYQDIFTWKKFIYE